MTGTGGWAYFSATRYMLGMKPEFDHFVVDPCVPADWKEFHMSRVWRGARMEISVQNPDGVMKGVREIRLDGETVSRIPVLPEGSTHQVQVIMGQECPEKGRKTDD